MTVRAFEKELVNEYDEGHKNMAYNISKIVKTFSYFT